VVVGGTVVGGTVVGGTVVGGTVDGTVVTAPGTVVEGLDRSDDPSAPAPPEEP
jgi:hypothetical protein